MSLNHAVGAKDVATLSTAALTIDRQVLINGTSLQLLDRQHHSEEIKHIHMEGAVSQISNLFRFVSLLDKNMLQLAIKSDKAEQACEKMIGIVHYDSTFVYFREKILTFRFALRKQYKRKLVATRILDNEKKMRDSDFLTGMSVQFYYHYIRVFPTMLYDEDAPALLRIVNGDNVGSKSPGTSHLHDRGFQTANTYELRILSAAKSSPVKAASTLPSFQRPTFYRSAKTFLVAERGVPRTLYKYR